jgi:hypothetical protein
LGGANLSSLEGDIKGGKTFKINRRNPMPNISHVQSTKQAATTGLPTISNKNLPELRNNSESKRTSEMRLNEIKMSYSHAKRTDEAE